MIALLGFLTAFASQPGTEFVIVLDNSCSMVEPHTDNDGARRPAADPARRAVLGAQIVDGLTSGTQDDLSVLAFPPRAKTGVLEVEGAEAIREIAPSGGTWFRGPLERARDILSTSDHRDQMLLVLSDGEPSDFDDPAVGRRLLGLDDPGSDFDTLVLGLFPDRAPRAERFLTAMARHTDDYRRIQDGASVATSFTEGYAQALGSRALTGSLAPGEDLDIEVGRYVTEVMAVTTSIERGRPFTARLSRQGAVVPPKASGDNGCSNPPRKNPTYCSAPRLHYTVWRAPHDPQRTDSWTLAVNGADSAIAYGLILRYDLAADVLPIPRAAVDEPSTLRARLTWKGQTFDDEGFFEKDGFEATARVGGTRVPLQHVGDGVFEGTYTPRSSKGQRVRVTFSNTWMSKSAQGHLNVATPDPLTLSGPAGLDFGAWRGGRWATTVCRPLTLQANHTLDPSTVSFAFEGLPESSSLQITPQEGGGYEVCARAEGCCGDLLTTSQSALVVTASDLDGSEASARVPVRYDVERTGFLRCWWPWLLALALFLLLLWFILGWVRPHDFDEDLTLRIAGSERQLSRSAALVLREQPKGRRGFYRNARIALTAGGDFVAQPRKAIVWFEATGAGDTVIHPQGPVEVKDRRTKKWVPLDEQAAADGIRTNIVYRIGDLYLRFQ